MVNAYKRMYSAAIASAIRLGLRWPCPPQGALVRRAGAPGLRPSNRPTASIQPEAVVPQSLGLSPFSACHGLMICSFPNATLK